jgi:hypothetical protein
MADPHQPRRTFFGPHDPFVYAHNDTYYQQKTHGYCGVCGKRTHYKSLYAAEYCCSVECSNELWCDITERIISSKPRRRRQTNVK